MLRFSLVVLFATLLSTTAFGQDVPGEAYLEPRLKDPVLEKIDKRNKAFIEKRDAETAKIRAAQKEAQKKKKEQRKVLRADLPEDMRPSSPDDFQSVFHFGPQAQYYTGTCWAYAGTSFLESEVHRITGKKVKLSEMHTVYYEYLEKARRFVQQRGDSNFSEGSQMNAVNRMWKLYGAVPLTEYDGVVAEDGLHDHIRMSAEMSAFLKFVKANDLWDEQFVLDSIATILNKYMGEPPQSFKYNRRTYTPTEFVRKVLKVDPDSYVQFMSTMSVPFYQSGLFDVPDNWWQDASYLNLPLEQFLQAALGPVQRGFSIAIGGDVSEPGKNFRQDVAFVPEFDIPQKHINQSAREYRIANGATGDDHGIHAVGWAKAGDNEWLLIKDSGRSARHGKHNGYYFFREDFIKLKMLTIMVHKDGVPGLLKRFNKTKGR